MNRRDLLNETNIYPQRELLRSAINGKLQIKKKYKKVCEKLAKLNNKKIFLLTCRNSAVFPNFLNIKKLIHVQSELCNQQLTRVYHTFKLKLLRILINDIHKNITQLNKNKLYYLNKMKSVLSSHEFDYYCGYVNNIITRLYNRCKRRGIRKYERLTMIQRNLSQPIINESWIVNLTNTNIPREVVSILQLGPKFAFEDKRIPVLPLLSDIEVAIRDLDDSNKADIRNKICNIVTNANNSKRSDNDSMIRQFHSCLKQTKLFLKNNKNIIITSADKCNKTIILEKTDYDNKMLNLLNDTNTYCRIIKDPTKSIQTKINKIISNWETNKYINNSTSKALKIYNGNVPKIYGLPKIHKENVPLRPIVSNINAATYKLSKFLAGVLGNVINKNAYYIKDSFQFADYIKNITLPNDHILVSFDMVSMFTNIPVELALQTIRNKWDIISQFTDVPLDGFIEATELVLNSTYFQFNEEYFKQHHGVAMGSPLSSIVAALVLETIEDSIIPSCGGLIHFFTRFVDDCLLSCRRTDVTTILDRFNNVHPRIKFTVEYERENSINFLDLKLTRKPDGGIDVNWYTKDVWSGRYINFSSVVPFRHKVAVINALVDRAVILSHPKYKKQNLIKIREVLKNNSYPNNIIDKYIKKRIKTINERQRNNTIDTNRPNVQYFPITYHKRISNKINNLFKNIDIKLAPKTTTTLGRCIYSKLKSKIPDAEKTDVIYKIDCQQCDQCNVGQTKNYFQNRIKNHINDVKNHKTNTALSAHSLQFMHTFNFHEAKIITQENNYNKRTFLEMAHIVKYNSVNYNTDIHNLSYIYHNLIKST